jgi:thiosulfate reductase cytochrome b subunit
MSIRGGSSAARPHKRVERHDSNSRDRTAGRRASLLQAPCHHGVVRATHWIAALSLAGLVVSGTAIFLAHPRLYWGETGALGVPSILDLRFEMLPRGHSGWGRHAHFEAAWIVIMNGLVYLAWGLASGHLRTRLMPRRCDLSWAAARRSLSRHSHAFPRPGEALRYNVVQRIVYLAVIFILLPAMVWTGLAMSPAMTSITPGLVTVLGGHQSARTIHFVGTIVLVIFAIVHVGMVWRAGFRTRVASMIKGRAGAGREDE